MAKDIENNFLSLTRPLHSYSVTSLQVNLGRLCNLSCTHCHLSALPYSEEVMSWEIMQEVIGVIKRNEIITVDITGGAPELNPSLRKFIDGLYGSDTKILLRTNLVALIEPQQEGLAEYFAEKKITLIASLPCYLEENVRAQRGKEVFEKSIAALKLLNQLGYGSIKGPGLNLVYNPGGPFLPGRPEDLEMLYRRELQLRYGIFFSKLLTLTNIPIGRFEDLLSQNGQLSEYLNLLQRSYNRNNLTSLMCRSQVSIGWDGTLYDCDFNLALGLPSEIEKPHISCFKRHCLEKRIIVTGNHCFGCTAGSGSSCSGALEASG